MQAIDAFFLRWPEFEHGRVTAKSANLPLLATQLGGVLHSLALRACAGWS
jgi:hypothetical protein